MNHTASAYWSALRTTLRKTAAAYGYTLTIATTVAVLTTTRGKPHTSELFLFVAGGIAGFAILDGVLQAVAIPGDEEPEQAFPFAGTLNFVSVIAALATATGVARGLHSSLAWLLAPMAATVVYMLLVALQITLIAAFRR